MNLKGKSILVDKVLNKINVLRDETKFNQESLILPDNISKADLMLLVEDKANREMFVNFVQNVFTQNEIDSVREKIRFYSLNKDKIENVDRLNKRRESLTEKLNQKKKDLISLGERKKEFNKEKFNLNQQIQSLKKKEESYLVKCKIIEQSKHKLKENEEEFNCFKLLENYKFMKAEKNAPLRDLNFEQFLDENKKKFDQILSTGNLKKLPNVFYY